VTNNNLGYAGPGEAIGDGSEDDDRLARPPNIRFESALSGNQGDADLVIFPKTPYTPCDAGANGAASHRMGSISVKSGTSVDLQFALVNTDSGAPMAVEDLAIKLFDLDQGEGGKSSELVSGKGFTEFQVVHGSAIVSATDPNGITMFHAGATEVGMEHDPRNATSESERRSVTLVYKHVSRVELSLEVSPGSLCQSFEFAARACESGCKMSDECMNQPAVDCKYSDWSAWTSCTATCGSGQRSRERRVVQPPTGNGTRCIGALSETGGCNNSACPGECDPSDCDWQDWGEWGECDKCGGERTRHRRVKKHARCGGQACDPGSAEDIGDCTRKHADRMPKRSAGNAPSLKSHCQFTCCTVGSSKYTRSAL